MGVLGFPVARERFVSGQLEPVPLGPIAVPLAGKVAALKVGEGQLVEKGQVLAVLVNAAQDAERAKLSAKVTDLTRQADLIAANVKPAQVAKARVVLEGAEHELAKATQAREKAEQAKGKKPLARPVKAKLDAAVASAQAEVDKAKAALAAATGEEKLAAKRAELQKAKEALDDLGGAGGTEVKAPSAGRVRGLVQVGATLAEGAELARLVSPNSLEVRSNDPQLPSNAKVARAVLSAPEGEQPVKALHWTQGPEGAVLVGALENPPKSINPGPTVLAVTLARRPFALTWFEKN